MRLIFKIKSCLTNQEDQYKRGWLPGLRNLSFLVKTNVCNMANKTITIEKWDLKFKTISIFLKNGLPFCCSGYKKNETSGQCDSGYNVF